MTESFVIQSDDRSMPLVEERLFHFCQECHVGDCFSTVSVAAMQAVKNAIVHGNGANPERKVSLTFGTCRGGVFVEVADEGTGFDYERFGTLPADGQPSREGIFIMKSLSDRMVFSDGGRRVRMEFMVAGISPADALERVAILKEHFALVAA